MPLLLRLGTVGEFGDVFGTETPPRSPVQAVEGVAYVVEGGPDLVTAVPIPSQARSDMFLVRVCS